MKLLLTAQLVIFLGCLLPSPLIIQAEDKKNQLSLILFTEINHPYVYYKEGTEQLTGIAYDIVSEMMIRAKIRPDIRVLPWLRALREVGKTDNACLFIMNRTAKREPKFHWVGPMIHGGVAIYKRPGSPIEINSIFDLKKHLIIGKRDGVSIQDLEARFGINILYTSSDEQAVKLLYQKRANLWAAGLIDGPLAAKAMNLPQPEIAFIRGKTDLSMGCSLNLSPEKLQTLQKAYKTMAEFTEKVINSYIHNPTN